MTFGGGAICYAKVAAFSVSEPNWGDQFDLDQSTSLGLQNSRLILKNGLDFMVGIAQIVRGRLRRLIFALSA